MAGIKDDFYEDVANRSVHLKLMKRGVQEKGQNIYVNSTKSETLQGLITEVGNINPALEIERSKQSWTSSLLAKLDFLASKIENPNKLYVGLAQ